MDQLSDGQYRPQRKFIHDFVLGLFQARSLVLTEIARPIAAGKTFHTVKRLSENLKSDRFKDDLLRASFNGAVRGSLSGVAEDELVVAVDGTEIIKPRGGRLPGLERIRDGSTGRRGQPGWRVAEAAIVTPDGGWLPVAFTPYSKSEGLKARELRRKVYGEVIDEAVKIVGRKTWWAFDREFGERTFLEMLDERGLKAIVRLAGGKTSRLLMLPSGQTLRASIIAETMDTPFERDIRRGGGTIRVKVGLREVKTEFHGKPTSKVCTLAVVRGYRKVGMFLVNGSRLTEADAWAIHDAYRRRWGVEDANQFLKNRCDWGFGIERAAFRSTRALERALLLVLAATFIARQIGTDPELSRRALAASQPLPEEPECQIGRLTRGIGNLLGGFHTRRLSARELEGGFTGPVRQYESKWAHVRGAPKWVEERRPKGHEPKGVCGDSVPVTGGMSKYAKGVSISELSVGWRWNPAESCFERSDGYRAVMTGREGGSLTGRVLWALVHRDRPGEALSEEFLDPDDVVRFAYEKYPLRQTA